jgi:hypothetical protein
MFFDPATIGRCAGWNTGPLPDGRIGLQLLFLPAQARPRIPQESAAMVQTGEAVAFSKSEVDQLIQALQKTLLDS